MIPEAILAFTWGGFVWGFLSFVVFAVSVLLAVVILVQDSKETGLTSAFGGGGGGGSALLGARMQKDLAKITTILAILLAVCLMIMSLLTHGIRTSSYGAAPPLEAPSGAAEPGTATGGDLEGTPSPAPPEEDSGDAAPSQGGSDSPPASSAESPGGEAAGSTSPSAGD